MPAGTGLTAWTIGHSRHDIREFLALLQKHRINVVVDVRTVPASRMAPQFNEATLRHSLKTASIDYIFMGKELGGRPDADYMYDEKGFVLYNEVAESELFLAGINRLMKGLGHHRVAVMCSEGDHLGCHRHLLVGRVLDSHGVEVVNILSDGSTASYTESSEKTPQATLFELDGGEPWKSARSVRREPAPNASSHA